MNRTHRAILAAAILAVAFTLAAAFDAAEDCFTDTCVGCTDDCLESAE